MSAELAIVAKPHLLKNELVRATAPEGLSLAEIAGPNAAAGVVAFVDGVEIPRDAWTQTFPRAGQTINLCVVPQGGGNGGNKALRTVLTIAVIVASIYTGGALAAANGVWGTASYAAAAAVSMVGNLAINALVPPPMPQLPAAAALGGAADSFNRLQSLTGTSNQLLPYGVIPRVYGKIKYFPPLAARPQAEVIGDDQYIRILLMLGYGDLNLSDIQIGDTAIANFPEAEYEIGSAEAPPHLFALDVEEDTSVTPALNADGATATRTTSPDTDEISLDLIWPQGLFAVQSVSGKTEFFANENFTIEYAPTGTTNWLAAPAADGWQMSGDAGSVDATTNQLSVQNNARETLRFGVRWKVANGQYDVRVTRVSTMWPDGSDPNGQFGDCAWGALRSFHYAQPSNVPGTVLMALRMKATDQLNGVVNQLNLVAESILPVYSNGAWVDQATHNHAWIAADVLTGAANKHARDKSVLDTDAFTAWATACDAAGREFNAVIDAPTTAWALLQTVFAAGRAAPTRIDGQWSVVQDTAETVPVQHITPRNSWGYAGTRTFTTLPHAVRVQFTNADANYQQDEIVVYDDGYDASNATQFDVLTLPGCTHYEQAWKDGRYHMAALRLRPDTHSVNMDFENLVARRGDLVKLAHDVISVGRGYGRIKNVTPDADGNATALKLDEYLDFSDLANPAVRIRKNDNSSALIAVTPAVSDETNLVANGSGQLGDNTNFSDFTRVPDPDAPGGAAFELTAAPNLLTYSGDLTQASWVVKAATVNAAPQIIGGHRLWALETDGSVPFPRADNHVTPVWPVGGVATLRAICAAGTSPLTVLGLEAISNSPQANLEITWTDGVPTISAVSQQINAYTVLSSVLNDLGNGVYEAVVTARNDSGSAQTIAAQVYAAWNDSTAGYTALWGEVDLKFTGSFTRYDETGDTTGFVCAPDALIPIDIAKDYVEALSLKFAPPDVIGDSSAHVYSSLPYAYIGQPGASQTAAALADYGYSVGQELTFEADIDVAADGATNGDGYLSLSFFDSTGAPIGGEVDGNHITPGNTGVSSVVHTIPASSVYFSAVARRFWDNTKTVNNAALRRTGPIPDYSILAACYDASGAYLSSITAASGTLTTAYQSASGTINPADFPAGTTQVKPQIAITTADGSPATTRVGGVGLASLDRINAVDLAAATAGIHAGDLFLFGESGSEAIDCKLTRIEPGPDLSAKLTFVDAAPAILNADAGPVPPFESAITGNGGACEIPPPPAITAILGGYDPGNGSSGGNKSAPIYSPPDEGGLVQPKYKFYIGPGRGPVLP